MLYFISSVFNQYLFLPCLFSHLSLRIFFCTLVSLFSSSYAFRCSSIVTIFSYCVQCFLFAVFTSLYVFIMMLCCFLFFTHYFIVFCPLSFSPRFSPSCFYHAFTYYITVITPFYLFFERLPILLEAMFF